MKTEEQFSILQTCSKCQTEVPHILIPRPDTPHDGELRCSVCGKFWGWRKKEKNNNKRPKNKYSPESMGIDFCQLCMRPKTRLGMNETLACHHVAEVAKGGEDDPGNIWIVCTPCHVMIHHYRVYLNDHTADVFIKYEELKRILIESELTPDRYEKAIRQISGIIGI
jgi:hypothetical protein